MSMDDDIITEDIIKNVEEMCDLNEDYLLLEIKLKKKYNCLRHITTFLLSTSKTKHLEKYNTVLEKYLDDNINAEELDENSDDVLDTIYHNYYGYLLTKYANDEIKKTEYTDKLVCVLEKTFDRTKNYIAGLDYMVTLFNNKNYQKVTDFYFRYKDFFHHTLEYNNLLIRMYCIVVISFIRTNQIQTINELEEFLNFTEIMKNVVNNKYYENEMNLYNYIKHQITILEGRKNLIKTIGFQIIENYDYELDENGLKDADNKIICPICYDTIEREKITVVQCVNCNKYIGHINCIGEYIAQNMKKNKSTVDCLNCRHKYNI
jgi:hypothetical protein